MCKVVWYTSNLLQWLCCVLHFIARCLCQHDFVFASAAYNRSHETVMSSHSMPVGAAGCAASPYMEGEWMLVNVLSVSLRYADVRVINTNMPNIPIYIRWEDLITSKQKRCEITPCLQQNELTRLMQSSLCHHLAAGVVCLERVRKDVYAFLGTFLWVKYGWRFVSRWASVSRQFGH